MMLLFLPIVLGLGLSITGAGVGAIIGVKIGSWLEGFLTEDEREDLETVLRQVINYYGLSEAEEIEQLPEDEQIEIGAKMSDELIYRWGRERFCEVEEQIERYLEDRGIEVRDHLLVSSR